MTRLYAHRGASREAPENTMVSFERALALGADALELDVHLTADGRVVVSHDPDGARWAGVPRAIADSTLAEVRAWDVGWGFRGGGGERPYAGQGHHVPLLDEVLDAFPGTVLNVDLKARDPRLVDAFHELTRARGACARVIAASFHRANLVRLRRRGYAGATALSASEVLELLALPGAVWRRLPRRAQAAQLPVRSVPLVLASPRVIRRCHALGLRVDFWTVNEPALAVSLVAMGADGIMTDDPARIAEALGRPVTKSPRR